MNREEILSAAQQEKYKGKELENKEGVKAIAYGAVCAIFLSAVLLVLQFFAQKTINLGFCSISTGVVGAQCLCEGIKTKKYWKVIIGILTSIGTTTLLIIFAVQIFMKV